MICQVLQGVLLLPGHPEPLFARGRPLHPVFSLFCSSSCVPSRFLKLSQSIVLEGGQALPITPDVPLAQAVHVAAAGVPLEPAPRPPTAVDPSAELILLQPPQVVARLWVGLVCRCCDTGHLGHGEVFLLYHVALAISNFAFSEFNLGFKLVPEPVIPLDSPASAPSNPAWFPGLPGKALQVAPLQGGVWSHGGLVHQKSQDLTVVQQKHNFCNNEKTSQLRVQVSDTFFCLFALLFWARLLLCLTVGSRPWDATLSSSTTTSPTSPPSPWKC